MRGLKYHQANHPRTDCTVAPYTGAWIEIGLDIPYQNLATVAPYTGAWIEMTVYNLKRLLSESHPTRVRGLKF